MADTSISYYHEYLKKQDPNGKWRLYWVVLNAVGLHFHFRDNEVDEGKPQEVIKLTSSSKCVLAKRRMYSFRFKIITEEGSNILKCDSILNRHRWMFMIDLVVKGRPPVTPPSFVPASFYRDSKWKGTAVYEHKLQDKNANTPKPQCSPSHMCGSKHIQTPRAVPHSAENPGFSDD